MRVVEYRIPLPFSIDEFHRGHSYMSTRSGSQSSLSTSVKTVEKRVVKTEPQTSCPFTFSLVDEADTFSFHHRIFNLES